MNAKCAFTVHNIAFQGIAPGDRIESMRLDRSDFTALGYEYWSQVSTMKAALVWSDTPLSPHREKIFASLVFNVLRNFALELLRWCIGPRGLAPP